MPELEGLTYDALDPPSSTGFLKNSPHDPTTFLGRQPC
jgi:hypothetical protein